MKRMTTCMIALLASAAAAGAQGQDMLAQQAQPGVATPSWLGYDPAGGATVFAAPELRSDPLTGETLVAPGSGMTLARPPAIAAQRRELSDLLARREGLNAAEAERLDEELQNFLTGPEFVAPTSRVPRTPPPVRPPLLALPGNETVLVPIPETPVPDAPSSVPWTPFPDGPPTPTVPVTVLACADGRTLPDFCSIPGMQDLEECTCE